MVAGQARLAELASSQRNKFNSSTDAMGQARRIRSRALRRRMSVAPRKRQLAIEERRVVKGQFET
jgi:hypothetical protein